MVSSDLDDLPHIVGGRLVKLGVPLESRSRYPILDIRGLAPRIGYLVSLEAHFCCCRLDLVQTKCRVRFGCLLREFHAISHVVILLSAFKAEK